jgi:hypothetical protein
MEKEIGFDLKDVDYISVEYRSRKSSALDR